MRKAPSSLMVSPFNMGFSMMLSTSCAYSDGLPSLGGNGTDFSKNATTFSGRAENSGVRKRPERCAHYIVRWREAKSTRCYGDDSYCLTCQVSSNGKSHSYDAPFACRVRGLSHLSFKSCNTRRIYYYSAFTFFVGLVFPNQSHSQSDHIEGANGVNLKRENDEFIFHLFQ